MLYVARVACDGSVGRGRRGYTNVSVRALGNSEHCSNNIVLLRFIQLSNCYHLRRASLALFASKSPSSELLPITFQQKPIESSVEISFEEIKYQTTTTPTHQLLHTAHTREALSDAERCHSFTKWLVTPTRPFLSVCSDPTRANLACATTRAWCCC